MSSPFNSHYNPKDSGREFGCWGKIKAILERTGVVLTVDEISYICNYIFHSSGPEEFYHRMDELSDKELEEVAMKAKLRKKPSLLAHEQMLYA